MSKFFREIYFIPLGILLIILLNTALDGSAIARNPIGDSNAPILTIAQNTSNRIDNQNGQNPIGGQQDGNPTVSTGSSSEGGLNNLQQFIVILLVIVIPPILFFASFWKLLHFIDRQEKSDSEERKIYISEIMYKIFEAATVLSCCTLYSFSNACRKV